MKNVIWICLSVCLLLSITSAGIVEDLVGKATGINVTQKIEEQNKLSEYAHNINDSQWKVGI